MNVKRLLAWALTGATTLLLGCANVQKMPWETDTAQVVPQQKSVYLLTATIKNGYKERYQPELLNVTVVRDEGKSTQAVLPFRMDGKGTYTGEQDDQPPTYLIRLELEPGAYTVRGFVALGRAFPIVSSFFVPLHAPLTVEGVGLRYLGRVEANVRERVGEEFRAGPMIPLIDQAVAGASGGTFDVVISDRFDDDLQLFRKQFPGLGQQAVDKALLPPFDRAKAQAWWQAN